MYTNKIIRAGKSLNIANQALIMVHGRGAHAEDILQLSNYLSVKEYALIAPEAPDHSWYPFSFLAPPRQNEPCLSAALSTLQGIVTEVTQQGIPTKNIYFAGFSQGACLVLEFVTRYATKYGGIAAFTGGLIGDKIYPERYEGDFAHTPVFIGTSDPDIHVPVTRVMDTAGLMEKMHAKVYTKIYPHMGHTILDEEIRLANSLIFDRGKMDARNEY